MVVLYIPSFFTIDCTKSKLSVSYASFKKEFEFPNVFFFYKNSILFISSTNNNLFFVKKIVGNYLMDVLSKINVKLEIVGFNYRAIFSEELSALSFFVGYTNVIKIFIPKKISVFFLDKKNKILKLQGVDRTLLLPFATKLRNLKRPNVYTGHGIRFYKEKLELKEVKK